jgi:hypothetical protein
MRIIQKKMDHKKISTIALDNVKNNIFSIFRKSSMIEPSGRMEKNMKYHAPRIRLLGAVCPEILGSNVSCADQTLVFFRFCFWSLIWGRGFGIFVGIQ